MSYNAYALSIWYVNDLFTFSILKQISFLLFRMIEVAPFQKPSIISFSYAKGLV